MTRTHVQIPELLLERAKRVAAEAEISLAQLVRLGLESMVLQQPPKPRKVQRWKVPAPFNMGTPLAPEEEWTALCHE